MSVVNLYLLRKSDRNMRSRGVKSRRLSRYDATQFLRKGIALVVSDDLTIYATPNTPHYAGAAIAIPSATESITEKFFRLIR